MARKKIIAGNWKMNKTPSQAAELIKELIPVVADSDADVVNPITTTEYLCLLLENVNPVFLSLLFNTLAALLSSFLLHRKNFNSSKISLA